MFSYSRTDVGESRVFTSVLSVRSLKSGSLGARCYWRAGPCVLQEVEGLWYLGNAQRSWCSVCITRTLSSLPEIIPLYRWIYVRVERLFCIYVEGCQRRFRLRLLEMRTNDINIKLRWFAPSSRPTQGNPRVMRRTCKLHSKDLRWKPNPEHLCWPIWGGGSF